MIAAKRRDADSSVAVWLKILGIVATMVAGAVGSYKAARSDSKTGATASYSTMKEAVERLEQNQKMMWETMLALSGREAKSADDEDKSPVRMPLRAPLRPLPRDFDEMVSKSLQLPK